MTILDRYIARQYLLNTLALLVLLFSFVVTVDVALNMDRFVSTAQRLASQASGGGEPSGVRVGAVTALLVVELWWPRLLQLFNFMIGLVLAGAMGFTLTQLVRHRELVAMMAGGVSLFRVARPVMLVALGFTLLQALNQELVLPRIAPLINREVRDAGAREWSAFEVRMAPDAQNRLLYARRFDPDGAVLSTVHVFERTPEGVATRRISADRAVWVPDPGSDPDSPAGAWKLENGVAIPLALGRSGSNTVAPTEKVAELRTDLDPRALLVRRHTGYMQSLSWAQIGEMLHGPHVDPELADRLQRVRFGRVSVMLCNLLGLLITLPFFLTREPRNMLVQSLKCAPVAIVTIMGGVLGSAAVVPGLPAAVGVFLPVLVLAPLAIATLSALRS